MKLTTDTHNHTRHFSPDACMDIDELIYTAAGRGLKRIAVTEHYEIDNPDPDDIIGVFDLDLYFRTFKEWKEKAEGKIDLLAGIEFGYQKETSSKIDNTASSFPFDQVILSNHLFRGVDVYYSKEVYLIPRRERHKEYIGKMAEMAENVSNFDIAAHYDYVNKYSKDQEDLVLYRDCPKEFDRLFEALIHKEKALEINTASIRSQIDKGSRFIMPDEEILKRYTAMGGKLISVGSDSHTKDTLGFYFNEIEQYLSYCGIKEVVYYKNRLPYTEGI